MLTDSLLRNSMYLMGTTAVTGLLGYLYWLVAAHTYSAYAIGVASALMSTVILASSLCSTGIGPALIQILPRCEAGGQWSLAVNAAMIAGAAVGVLSGGLAAAILPLLSPQFAVIHRDPAFAIALVIGVPLWTLSWTLDQVFVAERAAGNALVRNTTFAILKLLLLVLPLLLVQEGALVFFLSWVLAAGVSLIIGFLLMQRLQRSYCLAMRGIGRQMRSMVSLLTWNHLINLGGVVPVYLLPVLVTMRLSATDNAYFYTTWMLASVLFMASPAVSTSLFAEGSHAPDKLRHKVRSSVRIMVLLLGPGIVAALVGGRFVLQWLGAAYAQHGLLLFSVLAISAAPDAVTNTYISIWRVQGRLRRAAILNYGMAFLMLALTWELLPLSGIAGGGFAWLIAQISGCVLVAADLWYVSVRRVLKERAR